MRRAPGLVVVAVLGVLCMAPTAGDVGGCSTEVTELDVEAFARARRELDCRRCGECGIPTARCTDACDPGKPPQTRIPKTCRPILHDGEVCLRRLDAVSCDVFTTYVTDVAPSTPSECQFCRTPPEPSAPGLAATGGAR